MSATYPAFFEVTPDDQGPYAVVVAFSSISIIASIAVIRFLLATSQKLQIQLDDTTFAVGVVFAIANAICLYRAVVAGLGRHITSLGSDDLMTYYQLMYTAQLLGILSMGLSKVSVIMLFKRISPTIDRSTYFLLASVAFWTFFSIFATAFQCQTPRPWEFVPSQCTTHGNLLYPIVIFNMVTDTWLALGILPTVWNLNSTRSMRVTVMMLFGSRIVVVFASIGLLVSIVNSIADPDQTWTSLPRAIWDMCVILLSAITATIPRTNTFWMSLQSGKAGTNITAHEYELSALHSSNTDASKLQGSQTLDGDTPVMLRSREAHLKLVPPTKSKVSTRIFSGGDENGGDETELVGAQAVMGGREDDDASQSSLKQTARSGIYRNCEISVEVERVKHRER